MKRPSKILISGIVRSPPKWFPQTAQRAPAFYVSRLASSIRRTMDETAAESSSTAAESHSKKEAKTMSSPLKRIDDMKHFISKSFLFTALPAFCLMNGPLKRSLPSFLSFFCHATAIEWTAAGHKTQITITKGGIARFICFTPIASHSSSKIEFINSPFQPIKRKPSKSVICIEIYFYSAAARPPFPPSLEAGHAKRLFFRQPNWIIQIMTSVMKFIANFAPANCIKNLIKLI